MKRCANVYIGPRISIYSDSPVIPLSVMVHMDLVAYTTPLDPSVARVDKNRCNSKIGYQPLSEIYKWVDELNNSYKGVGRE